uniref:Uncharacterized protein n=1 Tax=Gadus morhua TaxID=8049 RepID=A0A8C5AG87_GADMO
EEYEPSSLASRVFITRRVRLLEQAPTYCADAECFAEVTRASAPRCQTSHPLEPARSLST